MAETPPVPATTPRPPPAPAWREPLIELERLLLDAGAAVAQLRRSLEGQAAPAQLPAAAAAAPPIAAVRPIEPTQQAAPAPAATPLPQEVELAKASFERLWERIDGERLERQGEQPPEEKASRLRGLDLLPQQYLMTVEDRESQVDLVPLHRVLLGFADMEDVSLVSFANGMPVISMRVQGELEMERLGTAVGAVMDRECEVIEQGNNRLFLRLYPSEDGGD